MRIGLVTDTHVPDVAKSLPAAVAHAFAGVDLILHAGDIYALSVLDELEHIAPVLAAQGDDDWGATLADPRVKVKHVLKLGGKVVWLIHEPPYSLRSFQMDSSSESGPKPDVVVFGHMHQASVLMRDEILWVNSGSPTFLRYRTGLGSVGILEIDGEDARAEIVNLQVVKGFAAPAN